MFSLLSSRYSGRRAHVCTAACGIRKEPLRQNIHGAVVSTTALLLGLVSLLAWCSILIAGTAFVVQRPMSKVVGSKETPSFQPEGHRVTPDSAPRQGLTALRARAVIADPPAPPEVDSERARESPFAQCLVEYKGGDGSSKGEKWLFHMDAAFEDEARAEKKPSFPRLLKKSSHIWARTTSVRCTPLDHIDDIESCAECVRLFVGGTYGGGVIVPAIDYKNPTKTAWGPKECLGLRATQQPPVGDDITYTESGGGGMPGHEQRMSTFCRTATFPGFD